MSKEESLIPDVEVIVSEMFSKYTCEDNLAPLYTQKQIEDVLRKYGEEVRNSTASYMLDNKVFRDIYDGKIGLEEIINSDKLKIT